MSTLFAGLISGTSADAVEAALVAFDDDAAAPRLVHATGTRYPDALRADIERSVAAQALPLAQLAVLDARIGDAFAAAARALFDAAGVEAAAVSAIGSHGQTLGHFAESTVQLGDPNRIAAATGVPVVADLRRADMACGGQGAPLAPLFHAAVFAVPGETRAVVNLGGIANLTVLGADGSVRGCDTGPANTLLDLWAARHGRGAFDRDGEFAPGGPPHPAQLDALRDDAYFARPPPKSTGRETFNLDWLEPRLGGGRFDAADVQATLAELTASTVADAVAAHAPDAARVLVCGGGVHNPDLMRRLAARLAPLEVASTEAYGVAPAVVEAMLCAWLARERVHARSPAGLGAVTGAGAPAVLGGVWLPPRSG